jgi:transposase-like protein
MGKRRRSSLAAVMASRYWRDEDGERVLHALRESGASVAAFARKHGVNRARLMRWRKRLQDAEVPRFHPVKVVSATASSPGASIELVLAGGHRIVLRRGFDGALLREIVRVLDGPSC